VDPEGSAAGVRGSTGKGWLMAEVRPTVCPDCNGTGKEKCSLCCGYGTVHGDLRDLRLKVIEETLARDKEIDRLNAELARVTAERDTAATWAVDWQELAEGTPENEAVEYLREGVAGIYPARAARLGRVVFPGPDR
jgi:hypothetical protein